MYTVCKLFLTISVVVLSILNDAVQGQEYLYRSSVNGWIKPHKVAATWHEAYNKCRHEGAELVAPVTDAIVREIKALINANQYQGQYLIDVKATYVPGEFSSTKGVPLHAMPVADMVQRLDREDGDCLSIDREQIRVVSCASRLPYFCYRQRKENEVLTECGTFDPEYHYNATTGSCYKFHLQQVTWQEAYSICVDEGGYLAVIDDEREAAVVGKMFSLHSTYIGIQALNGDAVSSIHGQPIGTIYHKWYGPSISQKDINYRCAFIYSDLDLGVSMCSDEKRFLCEKDPHYVQFSFSEF